MHLRVLLAGIALLHSSLTFATWREASSEHFVIYADENEFNLWTFSEKMERYHKAITVLFPAQQEVPSPSNRLTVYAIGDRAQARKVLGGNTTVVGFYVPRAGGSTAFIPPIGASKMDAISLSEFMLRQTYALHFKNENLDAMTPNWFTNGFIEYFSSTTFAPNGDIILGGANNLRAKDFNSNVARQISIEELLDSKIYASRKNNRYDNFFARSWSLFHYFFSNQEGRKKIADYLNRLNRGESELDSARAEFGDLAVLDRELGQYLKRPIPARRIPSEQISLAPITVRELDAAEAASIDVRMQSDHGIKPEETQKAAAVAQEARQLAAQYPGAASVLGALAKAEYDAGNDEAAIAAADQALAITPNHMNALIQKGAALARIATATKAPEDWARVRTHFVAVNNIEPEHPLPFLYFYLSFTEQGMEPTQNALEGLESALQVAPYDAKLRMTTAQAEMNQKRYQDAIHTLSILAFNSGNENAPAAHSMLEAAKQALAEQSAVP
ncbi:MAG: DUF1570 domain-containing protein [Pseudomonadales bacterium]|jgi:tetratricopeptide (TPR) repeat protein|nr:DUF1570 domain-containing protein [Pseudomonadales bacterium]